MATYCENFIAPCWWTPFNCSLFINPRNITVNRSRILTRFFVFGIVRWLIKQQHGKWLVVVCLIIIAPSSDCSLPYNLFMPEFELRTQQKTCNPLKRTFVFRLFIRLNYSCRFHRRSWARVIWSTSWHFGSLSRSWKGNVRLPLIGLNWTLIPSHFGWLFPTFIGLNYQTPQHDRDVDQCNWFLSSFFGSFSVLSSSTLMRLMHWSMDHLRLSLTYKAVTQTISWMTQQKIFCV